MSRRGTSRGRGSSRGSSLGSSNDGSSYTIGRGSSIGQRRSYGATSFHVVWGPMENSSSSQVESSDSGDSNKARRTSIEQDTSRRATLEGVEVLTETSHSTSSSSGVSNSYPGSYTRLPPSGYESTGDAELGCMDERAVIAPEITQEMERLRTLPHEELYAAVLRDEEGNVTSIGSIGHHTDSCSPCAFTSRSRGCKQGIFCGFCHFTHSEDVEKKGNRPRPCKAQRMRFQRTVDRLKSKVEENPEKFNADKVHLPPSIAENKDKKEKVVAMLKEHQFTTQALNVVDKYNEDKAKGKMSL